MPILGAVVHLPQDSHTRLQVQSALAGMPGLTFGECQGDRLPVVVESDSRQQDKLRWDRLQALPGLAHVELDYADFSDLVLSPSEAVEPA